MLVWCTALLILFFGVVCYCYRLAFYYRDPMADAPSGDARFDQAAADFASAAFEEVSISSHDGLKLTGRYVHLRDQAPLAILFHGYKGNAVRDFCGAWPVLKELGMNVLLADQRAHRTSEGHTITFGILEQRDCLDWLQYAIERFPDAPVFLMGVSMGAATVLIASDKVPPNVRGVIADCPYDAPENIIRKVLRADMKLPEKILYPFVRLGGRLFGRFDLQSHSPIKAVPHAKAPILLIHGESDHFVPCDMSRNLHAAAPDGIAFHTIPNAGHAMNQLTDPELYRSIVTDFIREHMASA